MADLKVGDRVKMKKPHPCGSNSWKVIRVGMDIKIECENCNHIVMMPRRKFEKNLKEIIK
ncbi:MAG TPA: DUF951 domain-containing protein [Halanaerobiales bacterium]|nr:DUF951 domain-containing protein [Halanaerobiales bacterium]